jgi:hypothetical protein
MRPQSFRALLCLAAACGGRTSDTAASRHADAAADRAFAAVQARGAHAMGVDQYTSTHTFEPLADGGRITLERDQADSSGADQIRHHMQDIEAAFSSGDFTLPGFVHAQDLPGTAVMTAKRRVIRYTVELLPRGAALRLKTTDTAAVRAIHEFLAFQRRDHHAGAKQHT